MRHMGKYGDIWGQIANMAKYGKYGVNMGKHGDIWEIIGEILKNIGEIWEIWGNMEKYGKIWWK